MVIINNGDLYYRFGECLSFIYNTSVYIVIFTN